MSCAPGFSAYAVERCDLTAEASIVALSRLLQRLGRSEERASCGSPYGDLDDPLARLALYDAHAVPTEHIIAYDAAAVKRARLWRDHIKPGRAA